jgi:NAD(P)H dehydrogenase (quinone)
MWPGVTPTWSRYCPRSPGLSAGLPRVAADLFVDTYTGIADGELAATPGDLRALIGRPTTTLADAVAAMLSS